MEPSKYQKAIYAEVEHGAGNLSVNAVAGSGKSTALKRAAKLIHNAGLYFAFNKNIVTEIEPALQGTWVQPTTIHSFGMQTLKFGGFKKAKLVKSKYWLIVDEWVKHNIDQIKGIGAPVSKLLNLIDKGRLTLTDLGDARATEGMCESYGIDVDGRLIDIAKFLLSEGDRQFEREGILDFTDMIWLPHSFNLEPRKYKWVLIDEMQDLSKASRELILKARKDGGRMLGVGDPRQAIYSFAGADSNSFYATSKAINAQELPLSISYRCPKSHVALAQSIVPQIEAAPWAIEGVITTGGEDELLSGVRVGDLVMCRRTAPLIKSCLALLRREIPAKVKGRELGKELADLAREIGQDCPYNRFANAIADYFIERLTALEERNARATTIETLSDKCEALMACFDGFKVRSVEELALKIEAIFSDDRPAVWLSTIHRAKGLEENRTWILEFDKLGQPFPRSTPDEAKQERNIRYIALTRSKHVMNLLTSGPRAARCSAVVQASEFSSVLERV